jgi:lipid-binding SYLF domain-containing protein
MFPIIRSFAATGPFLLALAFALPAAAASRLELDDRVHRAGEVFRELRDAPDRRIPAQLIARSRCVAVVPNVLKAAWVVGGRYGRGVLSCRSKTGEWSPPVHVMMTGGSFGLQFGASSTDVVLFFMTTASVRSLLQNKVKLSGEAGVSAGPVGREAEAATDGQFRAEIYSYARSRGLFAGVSLAGGYLGVQRDDTAAYYGRMLPTTGILFEHRVSNVPKSAWSFLNALPQPRRAAARAEVEERELRPHGIEERFETRVEPAPQAPRRPVGPAGPPPPAYGPPSPAYDSRPPAYGPTSPAYGPPAAKVAPAPRPPVVTSEPLPPDTDADGGFVSQPSDDVLGSVPSPDAPPPAPRR